MADDDAESGDMRLISDTDSENRSFEYSCETYDGDDLRFIAYLSRLGPIDNHHV